MLSVLTLVAIAPVTATAQPQPTAAELATRRQLIQQALRAHEAGQHQQALEFAQQALRIQVSASLLEVVATEQNLTGRFADALSTAEQCRRLVRDPNHQVQDREFVTRACDELLDSLPARVGHVTVVVPSNAPAALHVLVAGAPISSVVYNVPYVVNPGSVHITAELDGQTLVDRTLTVAEGATTVVPIAIPTTRATPTPMPTPQEPVTVRAVPVVPLVLLGVGAVTLGTSLGLWVARNGAIARLEAGCDAPDRLRCQDTSSNREAFQMATTLDTATGVVFGIGVAVTVGGATWLIIDRVTAPRRSGVSLRPHFSIGNYAANVGVEGTL